MHELRGAPRAILVPEEAIAARARGSCRRSLPAAAWSDLPVLVLTRRAPTPPEVGAAVRTLGNVTLLERPLRVATLLSAVRTALRARERQYQIRGTCGARRAEESLRLADQRKDEFLATLGHELRNPLAPLLTGLQLLKRRVWRSHARAVVERDGAPGRASDSAGRRPARGLAHHPGRDRRPARAARPRRRSCVPPSTRAGRRSTPPATR